MEISLNVSVNGMQGTYRAGCVIPEQFEECYQPLDTDDEPLLRLARGTALAGGETARKVMKTREDAAKIIAVELTKIIVQSMQANDTHNGYDVSPK